MVDLNGSFRAVLAAAFLSLPALPSAAADCGPALGAIVLDADARDWAAALANPQNVAIDADGSSFACSETSDRDCPFVNRVADLRRLVATWDEQALYLQVRTQASGAGGSESDLFVLIDRGDDGFFDGAALPGGDLLLRLIVTPSGQDWDVDGELLHYSSPASHPMGDPARSDCGADGLSPCADGWGVLDGAGTFDSLVSYPTCGPDCFDGLLFTTQFAVPWTDLGVAPGSPLGLHVSSDNSDPSPDGLFIDNLGGDWGAMGGTGFSCHELDPLEPGAASTATGAARFPHVVTNLGNRSDVYALRAESTHGWRVELHSDPDGDGDPADGLLLAVDADGNGLFLDAGDFVTPAGDSDGDGRPDSGDLPGGSGLSPGASFAFVVEVTAPAGSSCTSDLVRVDAESVRTGTLRSSSDRAAAAGLALLPESEVRVARDAADLTARHALRIGNGAAGAASVSVSASSASGWATALLEDADCDAMPDGPALPDPRNVPGGSEACFVLELSVPPGTPAGTEETTLVEAREGASAACGLEVRTTVVERLSLSPSYLLAEGSGRSMRASSSVRYPHLLVNEHDLPEIYTLSTLVSQFGFGANIFTDPNGDGSPDDGVSLGATGRTMQVQGGGGVLPLVLEVSAGAVNPGTVNMTTFIAVPDSAPGVTATVVDDTRIGTLTTHAEPEHARERTRFWPCETVHARAVDLGRRTEREYRFEWSDPAGLPVRSTVASGDELTLAADAFALDAAAAPGTWTVTLSSCRRAFDAAGVCADPVELVATAEFQVAAPLAVDSLATERPTHALTGEAVTVLASLRNADALRALPDSVLEYRIFTPAGTEYLRADGSFAPYSGAELTRRRTGLVVPAGATVPDGFTVANVGFPAAAPDYRLELAWVAPCGALLALESALFEVAGLPTVETRCSDGLDDDGDGAVDCADGDCAASPDCIAEDCGNGADDDGDGAVDCDDSECAGDPACGESLLVNRRIVLSAGGPVPALATQCACPQPTSILCAESIVPGPLAGLSLPGEASASGQSSLWLYQHVDASATMKVTKAGADLLFAPN